jgi:hypothetical protein
VNRPVYGKSSRCLPGLARRRAFFRLSRSWDGAELLHHAQVVVNYPPFGYSPVPNAEDVYALDAELLASRRNAKDFTNVLEVVGMTRHDPVSLDYQVLHLSAPLGKAREERTEPLLEFFSSGSLPEGAHAV